MPIALMRFSAHGALVFLAQQRVHTRPQNRGAAQTWPLRHHGSLQDIPRRPQDGPAAQQRVGGGPSKTKDGYATGP
eukprot:6523559-Pyramimonas_sp.AAC.1